MATVEFYDETAGPGPGLHTRVSLSNPLPVGGGGAAGALDTGNPLKVGGVFSANPTNVTAGQRTNLWTNPQGAVLISGINGGAGSDGGTNVVLSPSHNTGSAQGAPLASAGYVFNGTSWDRQKKPNLTSRLVSSAASTNATVAKASAGEVHGIVATNTTAAVIYLKLYNKATAPNVGTDTPVMTIALAPNNELSQISISNFGHYFSAGIGFALTGAAADADATAVTAGAVVGLNLLIS